MAVNLHYFSGRGRNDPKGDSGVIRRLPQFQQALGICWDPWGRGSTKPKQWGHPQSQGADAATPLGLKDGDVEPKRIIFEP